jgi:hypothetical protein
VLFSNLPTGKWGESMPRARPSWINVKTNYKLSGTHSCGIQFQNTCAIRMSEALVAADPGLLPVFKSSGKNVCPHGYIRGAQDLGAVLNQAWGTQDMGWEGPGSVPRSIKGKQGLVCFMNIPGFGGQGHIEITKSVAPHSLIGPACISHQQARPRWVLT